MNYQNGKIYSIRSYQTDKYYIGSTTQSLSKRLSVHKCHYRRWCEDNNKLFMTSYEIIKFGDVYIELMENCECNTKDELHKREGELIREHINEVVNKNIAGRKLKEYYETNKDKVKEYYETNKDKIKDRVKEYYETNKDKVKEYYETNKDKIKEYYKEYTIEYYSKNKEKIAAKNKARYDAKRLNNINLKNNIN